MKNLLRIAVALVGLAGSAWAGQPACSDKQNICLASCYEEEKYTCQMHCWNQKELCEKGDKPNTTVDVAPDEVVVTVKF